uniref:HTH containing DNA binding protein n=1 Tax=Marseillevirus sp. TaxID=2809551 RepID=A0AA96ELG1_9VIRU|nr:HTH containing DNA binding protein [Marseillevirus sp.]
MELSLLEDVLEFLSDEYQVDEEELSVVKTTYPEPLGYKGNEETSIVILSANEDMLVCNWSEAIKSNGKITWLVYGVKNTRENVLESLKKQINCSEFLSNKYHKEVLKLKEENSRLLLENERLKRENLELSFSPGGKGALEAQQHFERMREIPFIKEHF